jgi:hypothetical protein
VAITLGFGGSMKKLALILFAGLMVACGGTGASDGRSGDGGGSGTAGSGGAPPPLPQAVDETCRDWCANDSEGASCHQGTFESVQPCYEKCLRDYRAEEEQWQCGGEWIAIKDCQVALECEDLFGDCDSVKNEHAECVRLLSNRAFCEANCPNLDIAQCQQDTTECRQSVQVCDEMCGWPDECFVQLGVPLQGSDCVQTCEAQVEIVGIACVSAISSSIACLGTCDVESLSQDELIACQDEALAIESACE